VDISNQAGYADLARMFDLTGITDADWNQIPLRRWSAIHEKFYSKHWLVGRMSPKPHIMQVRQLSLPKLKE